MRSVQVFKPKGRLQIVEKDIPEPGTHQVHIKVQACGICHSDSVTKEGLLPGIEYPRVPGHKIVGVVDAIGKDVTEWKTGQRVGVGWHGGHCSHCQFCRRGVNINQVSIQQLRTSIAWQLREITMEQNLLW